jgi:hypothetical protein
MEHNLVKSMKSLLLIVCTLFTCSAISQQSDFIVLKKRNNRTVKSYFPGSYISAVTYTGFRLNGKIQEIRNDSIFIEQQEVFQVGTQFGVRRLDTVVHTVRLHYTEINQFFFSTGSSGRKKGFVEVSLPKLMIIGGTGFIVLELVNTAYRKESLTENNKIGSLAIAAGIAATGLLWQQLQKQRTKAGGKFTVVYVK